MKDIVTYISPLIESQFPSFYREDGPFFVKFVKAYYEWMEKNNNPLYHSRKLLEYSDIDQTVDSFLKYYKEQYLKNVQFDVATNKKSLIKNAGTIYKSKGTEASIDLFFKLVYGRPANIRYPGDDILKLSDNTWKIPTYIEVSETSYNSEFEGKQIKGITSGAVAFVESYSIKKKVNYEYDSLGNRVNISKNIHVFFITNLVGNFKYGEKVIHSGTTDPRKSVTVLGSLNKLEVLTGASNYNVGDIVTLNSNTGMNGKAIVSSVYNTTGQVEFKLIEGGWGYSTSPEIIISEKTMKVSNVTVANSDSPPSKLFQPFEKFIQPKANIIFNSLSGGTLKADDLIYNYYANNDLAGYGKIVDISISASTPTEGNLYVSILSGNLQVDTTFYNSTNTISATTVDYEDKTSTANIIAYSSYGTLTISDIQSGIIFALGEKIYQSNSTVETANATVQLVQRAGTTLLVDVSDTQGCFVPNKRIYGRSTSANGLVDSISSYIGIKDDSVTTVSSINITANGTNYSNGEVISISSNTGFGAYARIKTDVNGEISNAILIRSGSGYLSPPTAFIANSTTFYYFNAIEVVNNFITIPNHNFVNAQYIEYNVISSNTPLSGLTDNQKYYVRKANSKGIFVSDTPKGSIINVSAGKNENGHSFNAVISGGYGASFTTELGKPIDYENNLFFYSDSSNTSGYISLVGTGSLASFKVTSLDDEEFVSLNSDFLYDYNFYGADYMNILIQADASGANSALSGSDSYGFPANPSANLTNGTIESILAIDDYTIGSISLIGQFNPGEDYNLDPLVTVFEPIVYGYKKNDYILSTNENTTGFINGENILSTSRKNIDGKESIVSSFIQITDNFWGNSTILTYSVDTGNTVIGGLANNTNYYVVESNTSGFKLSLTSNGTPIVLTPTVSSEIGHYFENASYSKLGKIKRIINLNTIEVTRTSLFGQIPEYATSFIKGESSDYIALITNVEKADTYSGLNADVLANVITANGAVKTLTVIDSGFGYDKFDILSFQKEDDIEWPIGIAKGIVEKQGEGEGFYQNNKGFLSSDKYLYDGDFYQDYSYELVSAVPYQKYATMLKKVLHVAGTKIFPTTELQSNVKISVTASKNIEIRRIFNPTTSVNVTNDFISIPNGNSTNLILANTQLVMYDVDTGNTVVSGLANGSYYYVAYANSIGFKLSSTANGSNIINLQDPLLNEVGHGITNIL